jgi:hypothetical protein
MAKRPMKRKVEALVLEINALNAKVYAEQVKLSRKMAQEGIVPEPGHGKKSGMGCPMMSGGGMKHGMMGGMMGGMKHDMADGNGTPEQAPADQGGHDAHARPSSNPTAPQPAHGKTSTIPPSSQKLGGILFCHPFPPRP